MARRKRLTPATGVAAEIRPLLQLLPPGESVTVSLAEGPFWRRESYRAVNSAAHLILVPRRYRMSLEDDGTTLRVLRLAVPRPAPAPRTLDAPIARNPAHV